MKYGIKEYACTAVDMISRRTRLAFLNVQAAEEALPRIVELMGFRGPGLGKPFWALQTIATS